MSILTRPILEINLDNLIFNYKQLQKIIPHAEAAAVVKDDAYGIGATLVAQTLYEHAKCRCFFVAHAVEGVQVREVAPDAKIFVLQGIGSDCLDEFISARLIPVINSKEMLDFWKQNSIPGIKPAIQIETGLNRLGFRECDLSQMNRNQLNEFGLVMSHLACADAFAHDMNQKQLDVFTFLKETYFPNTPASLSASDGAFLGSDFQFDIVRLGAAMYGINTAPYRENQMKPVIKVKAPVLQIANLPKGEFVGYSATYRANTNRKIAIVSIGYGDGIPRSLSNVGKVFFNLCDNLHEARILGRISMDNIVCDVTSIDNLMVGDMADIICDYYTLDDIARDALTIGYEVLSNIGKNPRFIKKIKFEGSSDTF